MVTILAEPAACARGSPGRDVAPGLSGRRPRMRDEAGLEAGEEPVPEPDRLLSLAEWDSLPDDPSPRYELSRGVLVLVPQASLLHQLVMSELTAALNRQLPGEWRAVPEVAVVLDARRPPTIRIPDVVALPMTVLSEENASRQIRVDATDVVLAVEVLSPSTKQTDRVAKLGQYADAGIAHYWLVDLDPPTTLTAFSLVDGEYEIVAEGTGKLHLLSPAELYVDLDELKKPRPA
jgi:Uma2 family endonuclease